MGKVTVSQRCINCNEIGNLTYNTNKKEDNHFYVECQRCSEVYECFDVDYDNDEYVETFPMRDEKQSLVKNHPDMDLRLLKDPLSQWNW